MKEKEFDFLLLVPHSNVVPKRLHELSLGYLTLGLGVKLAEGINGIELGTLAH